MKRTVVKLFSRSVLLEPPAGLFGQILLAIKREQELQRARRLAFSFLALLVISLSVAPFSITLLLEQMDSSGMFYFISTMFSNLGTSLIVWQDFALVVVESLPIMDIILFLVIIFVFLNSLKYLAQYLVINSKIKYQN